MKKYQDTLKVSKYIVRLIALVMCSVLIGTGLMILLYAIPTDRTFGYAKASIATYSSDKIDNWGGMAVHSRLSNSTDALMIAHAVFRPYDSVIDNAMLNPQPTYTDSATENLVRYLSGEAPESFSDYARYWHGYLLYLIPALQVFTAGEIKILMMYAQFVLAMCLLHELGKYHRTYMFLFSIVILFINPVTTVLTFQDADIYCIMMISMILLLKYNEWFRQNGRYLSFFALNGVVVAFMDYLTYPLVAYGIPMITLLLINEYTLRDSIKETVINTLAWGWGYAGMWFGKWIMTDLLTGSNTIMSSLYAVIFRTSGDVTEYGFDSNTYPYTLSHLLEKICDRPMFILAVLAVMILCVCIYKKDCRYINFKDYIASTAAIALVGLAPFVWFFVVRNHTIIHPHLEYRQLAISIWAILVILAKPFTKIRSGQNITSLP